jgi:hypothetical protein
MSKHLPFHKPFYFMVKPLPFNKSFLFHAQTSSSWLNLSTSLLKHYLLGKPFSFMVQFFPLNKTFLLHGKIFFMAKLLLPCKTIISHGITFPFWQNLFIWCLNIYPLAKPFYFMVEGSTFPFWQNLSPS